jgi:hypothetical protein
MNEQVKLLFTTLADVPLPEREEYYEQQSVPTDLRAEVESLLSFDASGCCSLRAVVRSAARQLLRSCAEDCGKT